VSKKNQVISINRRSRGGRFQRRHNRLPVMLWVLAESSTGARELAVEQRRTSFPSFSRSLLVLWLSR
jgi:hypothetical protein